MAGGIDIRTVLTFFYPEYQTTSWEHTNGSLVRVNNGVDVSNLLFNAAVSAER